MHYLRLIAFACKSEEHHTVPHNSCKILGEYLHRILRIARIVSMAEWCHPLYAVST